MKDCLFCKIINKEIPSDIVYQDEKMIVFKDIHPKAPYHVLIVPKKHIESVTQLKKTDKELMGEIILKAKEIAKNNNLKGYKLVINVGRDGGQVIDHLHLHLLGGRPTETP